MSRFGVLGLSIMAAAVSASAVMASDPETPPMTLIIPIYPPQLDQGLTFSVPRDDSAPLTGDPPVLAPAREDQPLSFSLFTEPAPPPPPPPAEVATALAPVVSVPPVPRSQPKPEVRRPASATPPAAAPPAAVTPRRQPQPATPTRSPEPPRRIQPGWLLGVYR